MKPDQIIIPGDVVRWNDPDNGECSREGKIRGVRYGGEHHYIVWEDATVTGVLPSELVLILENPSVIVFSIRQGVISDERIPNGIKVFLKDYDYWSGEAPVAREFDNDDQSLTQSHISLVCRGGVIALESELPHGLIIKIYDYDMEDIDESCLELLGDEMVNIYEAE